MNCFLEWLIDEIVQALIVTETTVRGSDRHKTSDMATLRQRLSKCNFKFAKYNFKLRNVTKVEFRFRKIQLPVRETIENMENITCS